MMNGADQILPGTRVHTGFAADGAVHHREQRGRNLHIRDTAFENGGNKTSEIAHDSTAKRDHKRLSIQTSGEHLFANRTRLLERLRFFARRNDYEAWGEFFPPQTLEHALGEKLRHVLIGHNRAPFAG